MPQAPPGPRVLVIGNAPMITRGLFQDPSSPRVLSRFVDDSDVVVRMNNLKNLGVPGLGHRTDIHAVTNTGGPAARYSSRAMLDHPVIAGATEIWFGSAPELIDSGESEQVTTSLTGQDLALKIVAFQRWEQKDWRYIDAEVTRDLTTALRALGSRSKDPSLGARVVAKILVDPRFSDHALYVLGFGFRGVDAHDFDAEHRWFDQLAATGRISQAPGNALGRWFPHHGAAVTMRLVWKATHRKAYHRLRGRSTKGQMDQLVSAS
ncbi:MAG: hypothetical protein QNI91_14025 [Arenicellales bacterium]|nr:hypothetical protein [Arenicellales bacterium]